MTTRKGLQCMRLILLVLVVLSLGICASAQVQDQNTKKQRLTRANKTALKQAGFIPTPVLAMPAGPTDQTKVPHYFGPYPNWANSPFKLPDANVTITGDGTGATAAAVIGANGSITQIIVTNPGTGYTTATVSIAPITGTGSGATAAAVVTPSGILTSITVNVIGHGYTAPTVTLAGGGATTQATASAYGSVEAASLTASLVGGTGYTFPTVDFDMPDDPNGVQAKAHVVWDTVTGTITSIVLDDPGTGYMQAPKVVIRDGTLLSPITPGGTGASVTATISVSSIIVDTFGAGYTSAPNVVVADSLGGIGSGTNATAVVDVGGVTAINVLTPGSGYVTAGGMKKFTDPLPGLCDPGGQLAPVCPNYLASPTAKYIPIAAPDTSGPYQTTLPRDSSDTYEIALVQYKMSFSSSLADPVTGTPVGTLVRGYVQVETNSNFAISQHFPLTNTLRDGTVVPVTDATGAQMYGVTPPQYLGPVIISFKDKATRIVFRNMLPTGSNGDLFIPVDSTYMGSGLSDMNDPYNPVPTVGGTVMDDIRNPMCTDEPGSGPTGMCFTKNRATLHLHGGNTPWISDGTPHQWITPAGEFANWPQGVSVRNVPDMNVCNAVDDGCQTFYYTNQQSARLMFYHDHAWGITRLNVYVGEAAGYLITDAAEQKLIAPGGALDGLSYGIPLVVQDRTFVPPASQLAWQDPTWDYTRWGDYGDFWYHHVYMTAQNPGDPSGMSAFGRWMYGPWFWPPAGDAKYGPIANPYYTGTCDLNNPATWDHPSDPFCEPMLIPGTPNISGGMEQFNDTPIVNGTAYPTLTVEPKPYRFRILSAANDRFFNLQWYVGDPSTASTDLNTLGVVIGPTEVALNEAEVAAAQLDPVVAPNPDMSNDGGLDPSFSLPGPDWIHIGNEGGFLPAPAVVNGHQVITYITDPTRFDVGNVDLHSLALAPAERADVIVDFSKFAGQTLILYNDAPAAYPARVPSYDYYLGAPDLTPVGAPTTLPGYGPNTRTVMQVKVAAAVANPADPALKFTLTKLRNAFSHKADGSGIFESSQHPIIVGQAAYNSAYGTNFVAAGWCNSPVNPTPGCDGFLRISEQGGNFFKFDTLGTNPDGTRKQISIAIEPKALHDEMNASSYDDYGRMQANLGLEVVPATPGLQNVVLFQYISPPTEIIATSALPRADVKVTPISTGTDGTQIWKITHNGVDTHPIHFHATDVQVLNRVTWDNIIIPPDPAELGWKETLRISPLEDTIVALRPVIPKLPFETPNSIRLLSPMMMDGAPIALSTVATAAGLAPNAFAPNSTPIDLYNHYVNYGAEYVYHCHILSHEEMDMMRPVSLVFPPLAPSNLTVTAPIGGGPNRHVDLAWTDNSRTETAWVIERSSFNTPWTQIALVPTEPTLNPLTGLSTGGTVTYSDRIGNTNTSYVYRVKAANVVGDPTVYTANARFPTVTEYSASSNTFTWVTVPAAPGVVTATLVSGPRVRLSWTDNANNEDGFVIQRSVNGGAFVQAGTAPAANGTGNTVTFFDTVVTPGTTVVYQVAAANAAGLSAFSTVTITIPPAPAAPSNFTAANGANLPNPNRRSVVLTWVDNSNNETGFTIQRSTNAAFTNPVSVNLAPNVTTFTQTNLLPNTNYYFRIQANNGPIIFSTPLNATPLPILTLP